MRRYFPAMLAGVAMLLVQPVAALAQSDEAAVRQAVMRHYAAIGAGDLDAVIQHHTEHFTGFLPDNGLLVDLQSRPGQHEAWGPLTAAGFSWNVDLRHMQVVVRGNVAVAMFYTTGTITWPGQPPQASTRRVSEVWVKDGGQWLELHHHDSPLVAAP